MPQSGGYGSAPPPEGVLAGTGRHGGGRWGSVRPWGQMLAPHRHKAAGERGGKERSGATGTGPRRLLPPPRRGACARAEAALAGPPPPPGDGRVTQKAARRSEVKMAARASGEAAVGGRGWSCGAAPVALVGAGLAGLALSRAGRRGGP